MQGNTGGEIVVDLVKIIKVFNSYFKDLIEVELISGGVLKVKITL